MEILESYNELGLTGLFISSFLAATVIPFSSEAALSGWILAGGGVVAGIISCTLGNFLGGMSTYFLGYMGKWQWLSRYFGVKEEKAFRFQNAVGRYGAPIALLCWLPIIGEPVAIALGFFRASWIKVSIYMLVGKLARYVVLAYLLI